LGEYPRGHLLRLKDVPRQQEMAFAAGRHKKAPQGIGMAAPAIDFAVRVFETAEPPPELDDKSLALQIRKSLLAKFLLKLGTGLIRIDA
jgi:hypothetical protein